MNIQERISIPDLDFEYKLWKNRIHFYQQEIHIFLTRLLSLKEKVGEEGEELVSRLRKFVSESQLLEKEIRVREEEISFFSKDYPISKKHEHFVDHERLRSRMQQTSKDHLDLVVEVTKRFKEVIYV